MNRDEFAELAAGAALNALSSDDERRFRSALAAHPEWADDPTADADTVGMLSESVAPSAPPAGVRESLLNLIATAPQHVDPIGNEGAERAPDAAQPVATSVSTSVTKPRRWTRMMFALAACLALVVGVGVAVTVGGLFARPAAVVALEQIESATDAQSATVEVSAGGTATAHWSPTLGTAVLVADGIATLPEGKTYELWFVRGETPISAGVFSVRDGGATVVLEGDMHAGDVIAITVEQTGGSSSGLPTSDPIAVIATT